MPAWLSKIFGGFSGEKPDLAVVKQSIAKADPRIVLAKDDLAEYAQDIDARAKHMNKDLRKIYANYGITFNGFKAFDQACTAIKAIIKKDNVEAYNNLIKAEAAITVEMRRHLALIRMAALPDGSRVIDKINSDPKIKQQFYAVFGERKADGQNTDGVYQRLWSEVHKLAEYLIIQKDKVYH